MLKLTLKPGEYLSIGEDVRVVFSGGSANNIHLLIDAPQEMAIIRSNAGRMKKASPYYKEQGISKEAQKEIAAILMREKQKQEHAPDLGAKVWDQTALGQPIARKKTVKNLYTAGSTIIR